jgi:DNA-binding protein YbaB
MSENGTVTAEENVETNNNAAEMQENTENAAENTEDISYHAVEKEGNVTAIWEMQGRKHIRTIDPRSLEGKQILALFETAA